MHCYWPSFSSFIELLIPCQVLVLTLVLLVREIHTKTTLRRSQAPSPEYATGMNDSQSPLEHFHRTLGLKAKVAVAGWGRKGLERLTCPAVVR